MASVIYELLKHSWVLVNIETSRGEDWRLTKAKTVKTEGSEDYGKVDVDMREHLLRECDPVLVCGFVLRVLLWSSSIARYQC